MKLVLKIAIILIVARLMVHTPKGTNPTLDTVNNFTLREMAVQVDGFFTRVQEAVLSWISQA